MSDKAFNSLNILDQKLRKLFPVKGWCNNHTVLTISLINGFELFNTRPYHNYESWSNGYRIETTEEYGGITVEAEDLDDAIEKLETKIKEKL